MGMWGDNAPSTQDDERTKTMAEANINGIC